MYYFDHNATTPIAPAVLEVLQKVQAEVWGNPSSIHTPGQKARQCVEAARAQVAQLLNCDVKEVVFTSGGTESDNLAVLGAPTGHVVTAATEHPAILSAARHQGSCTVVPVDSNGLVDPDEIRKAIRPDTTLISVMHANNETGAIQPVEAISVVAREAGVLFHSDGVQATAKIPVDVRALGVDLYSLTAHKFSGPKGIGALYVRDGVKLNPRQFGGRHERERRAGTENVAGIAALGAAAALPKADLGGLRDRLEQGLLARIPDAHVNSIGAPRTPNTTNIRFPGLEGEALVIALDLGGFAVSSGAACSSGAVTPSHVLTAMGLSTAEARASIRFSLGRTNTEEQVDALIAAVEKAVARLRKLAPAHV
ncbi:cysteine desulfurase family protein [uncultured Paludibaculum sp.]|uniref:cysteine desulfurase family protein n=1 Tax=uncultured Paludibaculum sp. TaxID=1765020 RepID=UPI002AABB560|nr:cysteine desulfurase family protein [uncultured Paludibaculum sp.]